MMTKEDYIKMNAWVWVYNLVELPDGKIQAAIRVSNPVGSHENFTEKIVDGWVEEGKPWTQETINDPSGTKIISIKYVP